MSTARYERLNAVGREHYNERGDCSVKALAIFCDVSYGKAQAALKRAGRKPRCGAEVKHINTAVTELTGRGLEQDASIPAPWQAVVDSEGRVVVVGHTPKITPPIRVR